MAEDERSELAEALARWQVTPRSLSSSSSARTTARRWSTSGTTPPLRLLHPLELLAERQELPPQPRRIVTVLSTEECNHGAAAVRSLTPQAHLPFHNGPLRTAVEVFTIFWSAAWQQQAQNALIGKLNQFFDTSL